jgi:hypothetical protein
MQQRDKAKRRQKAESTRGRLDRAWAKICPCMMYKYSPRGIRNTVRGNNRYRRPDMPPPAPEGSQYFL